MKRILLSAAFLVASFTSWCQYTAVEFDYEKSVFNNGKPLPAESYFELRGEISQQVTMVEFSIFSEHGYPEDDPLYTKLWKRPFNNNTQRFQLPVNYNLRSSDEYDFEVNYFRKLEQGEKQEVRKELRETLSAYIEQNLTYDKKRIRLIKDEGRMVEEMNSIVNNALEFYRTPLNKMFPGFSDLVADQIERIEDQKQNKFLGKKVDSEKNLELKKELVQNLKKRVFNELEYVFNRELHVLADRKYVDDYNTEDVQQFVTLHGGYGGVYLDGADEKYGHSFAAGITLPLAKEEFSSEFWSRTSIMAGVYFQNFEVSNEAVATGPFVGRPYYLGLGYKFYRFLRLSAGGVVLENEAQNGATGIDDGIYVKPYISLTADINLFIGLAK